MAQGHDVLLLPMYTPLLTDEENVSSDHVFFGGVSVFLEQYLALFRHTPWFLDRIWDAPWLIRAFSGHAVQTRPEQVGDLTVSVLEGRAGHQAKEIDKLLHCLKGEPKPDVVDLANSMLISLARPIKETLDVPVCCTLQGEDIFLEHLGEPYRTQSIELIRESADYVDRFLAVSDYCAEHMCRYLGLPGAKVDVVPLGINVTGYEPIDGSGQDSGRFTIGHFGRIAPEKGTHLVCEAFRQLRDRGQHDAMSLRIAGYIGPEHQSYVESIKRQVRDWGLEADVTFRATLDREEKVEFLRQLDAFALPAVYDDPKGLALLEAMACGVPVVAPSRGTYTEMLGRTQGGLLVPPDDLDAFVAALASLGTDPRLEGTPRCEWRGWRPATLHGDSHGRECRRYLQRLDDCMTRRWIVWIVPLVVLGACRSGDGVTLAEVGITDTLAGAARFDGGLSRAIAAAWHERPSDYELRTRYVRTDRTPIYINRLFLETSPHLRRYAHSPISWFPWGDEAFETATRLDRPVLLSIGYATCEWCDVMQAESFDDEEVALYLNEHYGAVKVDRQARPDLQSTYMPALRQFAGDGAGWPMTLWLTPEREPYAGGTYYPRDEVSGGSPGFLTQLQRMKTAYDARAESIEVVVLDPQGLDDVDDAG